MDFLNKAKEAASSFSGSSGSNNQAAGDANAQQPAAGNTANAGTEDYGDKGLDFIEKKTGHTFSREQNEKVTDAARGFYEKQTGNKIDPKYSN